MSEIRKVAEEALEGPRWPVWAAVVLSLLGALVALNPYFPAQDGPNHLFTFHALQELRRADSPLRHFFFARLAGHVTYIAVEWLVLALGTFLPLAVADRLMVMLLILAFPLAILYFLRRVNPRGTYYVLAAPILQFNWILHMGFWNQLYGYVIMLVAVGYAYPRLCDLRRRDLLAIAVLFIAAAAFHPIVVVFALCVLGLCALIRPVAGRRLRTIVQLGAAAVPATALIAYGLLGDLQHKEFAPLGDPTPYVVWETIGRRLTYFFGRLFFSPRAWAIPVYVLLLALMVFGGFYVLWRRVRREDGAIRVSFSRADAMLAVATCTYVGYLLLPQRIGQPLSFVADRAPVLILVFFLGWLPPPAPRFGKTLGALLTAAAAFLLVENLSYVRQWNQVLREYTSGVSHVSPGAKILPLFFDTKGAVPSTAFPIVQAWAYYAVSRDVISPYSFACQPHIAIGYHRDAYLSELPNPGEFYAERRVKDGPNLDEWRPELNDREAREQAYQHVLDDGKHYDYLIVWRAPEEFVEYASNEGFSTAYSQGRVLLLRPPGKGDPPPAPGAEVTSAIPWTL